jgi:predicted RNA methylase
VLLITLETNPVLAIADRWHFRMLNDTARNTAYDTAIRRAVAVCLQSSTTCTVLDIGSGTGVLSMMALRAGATHVYSCEHNQVLCHIAAATATANSSSCNSYSNNNTILHAHSTALRKGIDLPECGVDIIVTELVDSGLLGEKIIPVLQQAARDLLAVDGTMIPQSATVWGCLIESKVTYILYYYIAAMIINFQLLTFGCMFKFCQLIMLLFGSFCSFIVHLHTTGDTSKSFM